MAVGRILTVTLNPALDISTEADAVRPDVKLRCAAPRSDPGGGGVNVSRALRILGGDSVPLVALGGPAGEAVRALLARDGLAPVDLGIGQPTRQSLAVLDRATGRQYRFVMPGAVWSPADCAAAADHIAATARPGDVLVPSGSLPPGVPADFFVALNTRLAGQGVRMVLDTSGPALEAAAAVAGGAPLFALRMDREEAQAISPAPLPDLAALAALAEMLVHRKAAGIVAISSGAEGSVVASADGLWLVRAPKVPVVSKVGAGDSFVAGFTLALTRGGTAAAACAAGVAAASSAVSTPDTMLCERAAVERYLKDLAPQPI